MINHSGTFCNFTTTKIALSRETPVTVLDMTRHSNLRNMIRTRAWINCFLANLEQSHSSNKNSTVKKEPQPLTQTEERTALFDIIRQSQAISHAKTKKHYYVLEKNQLIRSLGLFTDQHDIIRCRGRLRKCNDLSLQKGAHTTYPGSIGKADCGRLPHHKRTLHYGKRATLIH